MYAILQCGGHQVRVAPGSTMTVDRFEAEAGSPVTFDQVLLVSKDNGELIAGAPYVAGARVVGVVDDQVRGPKIRVFMKKRRKGMRRTHGHRSDLTQVRVTEIVL